MDLYILNKNLDAVAIVDSYTSLIWTDRYHEAGDFELYLPISKNVLDYLKQDYYVWRNDSDHVMIIEKLLIEADAENGDKLTVTGRSLESILDRRIAWGLTNFSGNLQECIRDLLIANIISPSKPERTIDNFIFQASTDPEITKLTIDTQFTGDNIYDIVTTLCVERNIGFKITINDSKQFVFSLYTGEDRSYDQFANPYVIFSPNFDNINNSNYVESKSSLKNVTLVGGEGEGSERRYTAVGNVSGLDRRELFTDARDISSEIDEDITEYFDFSILTSYAYSVKQHAFVTDPLFNSAIIDVSNYVGRTISLTIPKYSPIILIEVEPEEPVDPGTGTAEPDQDPVYEIDPDPKPSGYATILVDANGNYVSTIKEWEQESAIGTGSLETIEYVIPHNARFLFTSMFSQTAIDNEFYNGEVDDFQSSFVRLSSPEYINLLRQRGKEDLSENIEVVSFDGELDPSRTFIYGRDFFVGDLVSVEDSYGHQAKARILELITSQNEDGSFSMYPTFSTMEYEDPGEYPIPEDYTQLTYIQSDGTQWIDTGFKPNQNTRVVMDIQVTEQTKASVCLFGERDAASFTAPLAFNFWSMGTGTTVRTDYFGDAVTGSIGLPGYRAIIDKNKNICTVGSTVLINQTKTGQATLNLYLLNCNNAGSVNETYGVSAKLYSCKIYDNEVLVRDFTPVKDPTGLIGLYDRLGGMFYMSPGTTSFVTE